jgi:radical SAM superfamily enzyme YgiQ (UPF0313 family)
MNIAVLEIQFEDNAIFFPSIHYYLKSYYIKFGKNVDKIKWKEFPFIRYPSAEQINDMVVKYNLDILLCSVYTWNNDQMVKIIENIKKLNPQLQIVFGGPHVMTLFEKQKYFNKYKFVDVAVLGDGETAITEYLDNVINYGFNSHKKIQGVAYNSDDLNSSYIPARCLDIDKVSPYLDLKEEFIQRNIELDEFCQKEQLIKKIVVDTNRGCPYRCTFCDWGGNSHTKVVKRNEKDLYNELTLVLENKFDVLNFADANYGLYDRDVDVMKFLADYKKKYGYPSKEVSVSFAKTDKASDRILKIFELGWEVGFFRHFNIHLQDFDKDVLKNIKRTNLSNNEILRIKKQLEEKNIPIKTQFILGLPGQNKEKILESNTNLINLNLSANSNDLLIALPGSEMSDPNYKEKYQLQVSNLTMDDHKSVPIRSLTDREYKELSKHKVPTHHYDKWQYQDYVTESYSFSKEDFSEMICLHKMMGIFEYNWMLKPLRIIANKQGIHPHDFYSDIFENIKSIPSLNIPLTKGKTQIEKWLSGRSKFMKVYEYDDKIFEEFEFALNFENYLLTYLLLYKENFINDLRTYFKDKIESNRLEVALKILNFIQIDDGKICQHEKKISIKNYEFERIVDPALHIYQEHDRAERSMMLSTCYDLRRMLNVYNFYKCNGKQIDINHFDYFLNDFYF